MFDLINGGEFSLVLWRLEGIQYWFREESFIFFVIALIESIIIYNQFINS
jgi:hypothetical protein